MAFTAKERKFLKWIVSKEYDHFKREKVLLEECDFPIFAGEIFYERFLEGLLKKLGKSKEKIRKK